jgi:LPS-assembly protein
VRALHVFVIVIGLAWGGAGLAQAPAMPQPSPTPAPSAPGGAPQQAQPSPQPSPAAAPAAAPAPAAQIAPVAAPPPQCTLDEPCVRADRQGYQEGRYWFEGFVDIRAGDVRIQADQVDIRDVDQAEGKTRILTATGNVVFLRDEERLAGGKLTIDLGTSKGTFEQASGYMEPGVFIEGRSIERLAPDRYRIAHGRFTSCSQPNPRWSFSAGTATIHVDHNIKASNVLFKVKSVPAFYLPYIIYPIRDDQRSTGFLFPHFGYSSTRGFNTGGGFFWAMGRSFDQTFYADYYSLFGHGFGHEFRYALDPPSRAVFRTYALQPKGGGDYEYDLDWNLYQALPGRARATLALRKYSSVFFQSQIQDNLNQASTRTQTTRFNLQKSFGSTLAQVYSESNDTFFGERSKRINRRLPGAALTRRSQRIGKSPVVFAFDARAEQLESGDEIAVDRYSRVDVAPTLSLPVGNTWAQLTPSASVRYTRYGASLDGGEAVGPSLERRFFEGGIELAGPNFSRVFNAPGRGYSEKYKHVIGPEITWRYRTRIDDFDVIPKFDGNDQFLGTNQIEYALVNRLLAKRPSGAGTRTVPYEFLTWRVSQTYYVDIAAGQNEFDPNYSSSAFGPGGRPDHNSPILSNLRFRPTPRVAANFNLEYDINFKQVRRIGLSTAVNGDRAGLQVTWSRALRLAEQAEDRTPTLNTLRGSGSLKAFADHLTLVGSADYDAVKKMLIQSRAQVRWDVQCCGFVVELIRYNFNLRQEKQFRFAIELANVGSIGNFAGAENRRLGLGGGR